MQDVSVADEARMILESLERDLFARGLDWRHVVYVGVYLSDMSNFGAVNAVYSAFLPMRYTVYSLY